MDDLLRIPSFEKLTKETGMDYTEYYNLYRRKFSGHTLEDDIVLRTAPAVPDGKRERRASDSRHGC